ncbi:hypothetical protein B0H10DRAFT_2068941 [Mycena sp. CBHHK59/15]|nr:hypothetical protein B0H10DRAFT_2068941 [Mycena sp. CBHHK59/15]
MSIEFGKKGAGINSFNFTMLEIRTGCSSPSSALHSAPGKQVQLRRLRGRRERGWPQPPHIQSHRRTNSRVPSPPIRDRRRAPKSRRRVRRPRWLRRRQKSKTYRKSPIKNLLAVYRSSSYSAPSPTPSVDIHHLLCTPIHHRPQATRRQDVRPPAEMHGEPPAPGADTRSSCRRCARGRDHEVRRGRWDSTGGRTSSDDACCCYCVCGSAKDGTGDVCGSGDGDAAATGRGARARSS